MEVTFDAHGVLRSPPTATSDGASPGSSDWLWCPVCWLQLPPDRFPDIATCRHRSCDVCLRRYLRTEISESRVDISCPECPERFDPCDIRRILLAGDGDGDSEGQALADKYEGFALRRCLAADPQCRWCPAPDCGYAVIALGCRDGAGSPKITCGREGCGTEFCYRCRRRWHPERTCEDAATASGDVMPCPGCAVHVSKWDDWGCNHMTCTVCGCHFCWLCMERLSPDHYYDHFGNPSSGCRLLSWSRKRRVLYMLALAPAFVVAGVLAGAAAVLAVGIAALAVAIAIPYVAIAIPVGTGIELYKMRKKEKKERKLIELYKN